MAQSSDGVCGSGNEASHRPPQASPLYARGAIPTAHRQTRRENFAPPLPLLFLRRLQRFWPTVPSPASAHRNAPREV